MVFGSSFPNFDRLETGNSSLKCNASVGSHEAHFPSPVFRIFEKLDDLLAGVFGEVALAKTRVEDIVPIGEHVQADIILRQIVSPLVLVQTLRSIVEDAQAVGHFRASRANADIEAQLAESVGDKV